MKQEIKQILDSYDYDPLDREYCSSWERERIEYALFCLSRLRGSIVHGQWLLKQSLLKYRTRSYLFSRQVLPLFD